MYKELDELFKEFEERLNKLNEKKKLNDEELLEKIKQLTTGYRSCICITDKGDIITGTGIEIMTMLGLLVHNLKEKMPADKILKAVEIGLKDEDELEKLFKEALGE